jgi:hypothetical protein
MHELYNTTRLNYTSCRSIQEEGTRNTLLGWEERAIDGEARGCQGRWALPVTISLNIQGRRSSVSWIAFS